MADRGAFAQAAEVTGNGTRAGAFNVREFASYLWQFYLPRVSALTPVRHHVPVVSERPVLNTWIASGSAAFGWVNVWFPKGVYWIFYAAVAFMFAGGAVAALRWWRRRGPPERWRPAALGAGFLALVTLTLIAALHWTDYGFYRAHKGLFAQGRYLFPAAAALAALAAFALDALPRRARPIAAGVWIGGLVALQIACLGLVTVRWYA